MAPSLTDERELFLEFKATNDAKLREAIIEKYVYIAEIISKKFTKNNRLYNNGMDYEDIYQVACLGLLYAVERFDPDKGVKFASFATPTIIGEVRRYFRDKGFKYLQFIPCLRPFGDKSESELYMTNEQYADFLIKCFNYFVKDYVRGEYTSIRYFDNLVHMYVGNRPEQCGVCGHCTHQFVVEGNGNVYPCDFYCTDEWLLGNVNEESFAALANCEKAKKFIFESLKVDEKCKNCKFYPICRSGGCKRNRADRDYCEAYKKFFSSCLPLFRVFINERKT